MRFKDQRLSLFGATDAHLKNKRKFLFAMDSIRDIIPQVIENLSGKRPNSARNIHEVWKMVVKEGAPHSTVMDFKKGILRINVDSSAWLYQLNLQKAEFLKGLKNELPELTDIIYKVGK